MATATIALIDKNGSVQANLSAVSWAWFDQDIGAMSAPTDKGSAETTDGAGDMALSMPTSSLTSGQFGSVLLYDSTANKIMAFRVAVD